MSAIPTRKVVSQACDACRRRKIKCNGRQPCPGCMSANLACTFNVPQRRGGNQGVRATVLNELRDSQGSNAPIVTSPTEPTATQFQPSSPPNSGLESITIDACIRAYLQRIYPVVPFLDEATLRAQADHTSDSILSRQFIVSFCAYVVTFGTVLDESLLISSHTSAQQLGTELLNAALRIHNADRISTSSPLSVFVSFFLYGAYAGLGNYRQAWFYLREVSTLLTMQKIEGTGTWPSPSMYRRMFWVSLISERAHAIRKYRPITLQVDAESPELDDVEERGLQYLASIFRPFDQVFFAVWTGATQSCGKDWLLTLERDVRTALPHMLDVPSEQVANLRVSQLWLQIKLWELFPRFGFLSSESVYECLTFRYPIVLARALTMVVNQLPITSLQVHGVGMTEKIFDVGCALVDVLPFITTIPSQLESSPADYLIQTASLLTKLPGGSTKFVPLLLAKVNELQPDLITPLCEAMELPISTQPLSPDTQFLYEEEVRTNLLTDLRRGR